uniref:Panitide L4 n=1 Tax=Steinchisma laxum TaxID=158129 RepID=K9Y385_9POAL|nr:panitide L4 [Steinchisma laxum]AFZ39121.1 panitide L4 [Steinchisma laxum]
MESSKRVAGVVAIVLLLQLMAAPNAMARKLEGVTTPIFGLYDIARELSLAKAQGNAKEVGSNQAFCGETCLLGTCYTPGCRCTAGICLK